MSEHNLHAAKMNLSVAQKKRLMKGLVIRVKHEQIGEGEEIHLTAKQYKKMTKAYANGVGFQFGFDGEQGSVHSGKGAFGDFFSSIAGFLGPKAVDLASSLAGSAGKKVVDKYSPDSVKDFINNALQEGLQYGNSRSKDELASFLSGLRESKNGSGLFDFIPGGVGDFLNGLGNTAINVGAPIATGMLMKRLGGGKGKKGGEGLYLR